MALRMTLYWQQARSQAKDQQFCDGTGDASPCGADPFWGSKFPRPIAMDVLDIKEGCRNGDSALRAADASLGAIFDIPAWVEIPASSVGHPYAFTLPPDQLLSFNALSKYVSRPPVTEPQSCY